MVEGEGDYWLRGAVEGGFPPGVEDNVVKGPLEALGGDAEGIIGTKKGEAAAFAKMEVAGVRDGKGGAVVRHH